MPSSRRRSPEQIEAMRTELLEGKVTFKELAVREGVSPQRISQLVGPLNHKITKVRRHRRQEAIATLVEAGHSDREIAYELGLSFHYVARLRREAGINRPMGRIPRVRWTKEMILQKAKEWREHYGYTPGAMDWNPAQAISKGCPERAKRFHEFGAPRLDIVQKIFGSWSEMIRQSGLPPAPWGGAAIGYWKKGQLTDGQAS